jgi:hypothetical protein
LRGKLAITAGQSYASLQFFRPVRPTDGNYACNISARLAGKTTEQGWQTRLPGKDAGQAMVHYKKNVVKLDNNAVISANSP